MNGGRAGVETLHMQTDFSNIVHFQCNGNGTTCAQTGSCGHGRGHGRSRSRSRSCSFDFRGLARALASISIFVWPAIGEVHLPTVALFNLSSQKVENCWLTFKSEFEWA